MIRPEIIEMLSDTVYYALRGMQIDTLNINSSDGVRGAVTVTLRTDVPHSMNVEYAIHFMQFALQMFDPDAEVISNDSIVLNGAIDLRQVPAQDELTKYVGWYSDPIAQWRLEHGFPKIGKN